MTAFLAIAFMFLLPECLEAQTPGRGHELSLSIAGAPVGAVLSQGIGNVDYIYVAPGTSTVDRYADTRGKTLSFGTLCFQYYYNLNKKVAVGINFGYDILFARRYDGYTGEDEGLINNFGLSLYPDLRMTWNPDRKVKVFSSIGLGVGIAAYYNVGDGFSRYYDSSSDSYVDSSRMSYVPVLQLSPVGISFGRKVFGFAEVSIGTLYTGGRTGIGYKF